MALIDIFPKEYKNGDKYGFKKKAETRSDKDYTMITGLKEHFECPFELIEVNVDRKNEDIVKYISLEGTLENRITTEITESQDKLIHSIIKQPKTYTYSDKSGLSVIYEGRRRVIICAPHWFFTKIKNRQDSSVP